MRGRTVALRQAGRIDTDIRSPVEVLRSQQSAASLPPVASCHTGDVIAGLDLIIRSRPPLRLVLAARSDPLLPVHRYRLAGLMQGLRAGAGHDPRGSAGAALGTRGYPARRGRGRLSTAEIAAEMCLSVNTVKTHLAAIYRKLTASRRKDAVLRARELELL
jgi:hypothetical protein